MGDVDLFDPATQQDWYPAYDALRDDQPVYRIPGSNIYVLTRYDDVMWVLRHQDLFPTAGATARHERTRQVYRDRGWDRMMPLSVNPPEHRWYRALVDPHFNGAGAERWQPEIEAVIDDLIDGFAPDGYVELVEQFAMPLPLRLITHILGLPADDIPQLKEWSAAWVLPFSGPLPEDQEVWVAEQVVEFQTYLQHHIDQKRQAPGADVLSALVAARWHDERPLTDPEIISMVDHLFIGGNETTTFAITSALWLLLREEGLYPRIMADRSLIPAFVEEVLRLESPTQGLYRAVAADVERHGVTIPAGSIVHIRYGAANRDERMFACPHEVDLDRANAKRHMAFSLGEHSCPGSGLSRLEQRLALAALLERLPDLRLAEGNDFAHEPGFVLRALTELHLEFTPG
ncbi:MAG: cytochrome P450 [Acidimicrobiia bacterium]|nr:cytochrome P450 [Acidimicrobiia bacterium]